MGIIIFLNLIGLFPLCDVNMATMGFVATSALLKP